MPDKIKGLIVTARPDLDSQLASEVRPIVDVMETVSDYGGAYGAVRDLQPGAVFVDIAGAEQTALNMIRRLTRHYPESRVYIVAQEKNPDLILEGFRSGAADYLLYPGSNGSMREALRQTLGDAAGGSGELIALFSVKGGQGNTTLAVNLADHLQQLTWEKICLADLNLYRGDVGVYLNMNPDYTGYDLLKDIERVDQNLLFSSMAHHPAGFYVLPSTEEISDADQVGGEEMRRLLSVLQRHMDYVIADIPHDFAERAIAVLDAADTILLVAQQNLAGIKSVQQTLELFQQLNYGGEKVRIVLNRHLKKSDYTPEDLEKIFKQPVFGAVANDYAAAMQAVNKGKPLSAVKEKATINRDIQRLAKHLAGPAAACHPAGPGWKNSLGALFARGK